MALALVRKLYKVAGGGILEWGAVDLIVHRRDHVDALEYAVEEHWIGNVARPAHRPPWPPKDVASWGTTPSSGNAPL